MQPEGPQWPMNAHKMLQGVQHEGQQWLMKADKMLQGMQQEGPQWPTSARFPAQDIGFRQGGSFLGHKIGCGTRLHR